jgi:hypothetical protein
MALCIAVFATVAPQIAARAGAHRTVAFGMLLMVVGLILFARLGLGLLLTILLLAAGVVVSYLTLRPRTAGPAVSSAHVTAAGEIEAVGESLGELVIADDLVAPMRRGES